MGIGNIPPKEYALQIRFKSKIQVQTLSETNSEIGSPFPIASRAQYPYFREDHFTGGRPLAAWIKRKSQLACQAIHTKKSPLSTVTNQELAMIRDRLNSRPKKRLGSKTPNVVFHSNLLRFEIENRGFMNYSFEQLNYYIGYTWLS